ncbi:MAG: hypothetical protein HYU36_17375 [Planctomycetes bacterium]|nr:hypothetical protein [Planctomycetota bacterium]
MNTSEKGWLLGLAVLAGLIGGALGSRVFAPEPSMARDPSQRVKALYAETFVLVDAEGRTRAQLVLQQPSSPSLTVLDEEGKTRAGLVLRGEGHPTFGLFGREQKAAAILAIGDRTVETGDSGVESREEGGPFLRLKSGNGKAGLFLSVDPTPRLVLLDVEGRARALLALDGEGAPSVDLRDGKGVARGEFGLYPDGSPSMSFMDTEGKGRAGMVMNRDGSTRLGMMDAGGRVIWSAPTPVSDEP